MVEADNQHAALCAARPTDTVSQLVEVNVTMADWLAHFRVMTQLPESYKVEKLASEIQI